MRVICRLILAALTTAAIAPAARGGYVEVFQSWQAVSPDLWEVADLSGAPYNVPANAVVDVAVRNLATGAQRSGGVRAVGSGLDRRFTLHEAEGAGSDAVVMHVQADGDSRIEHYSDVTTKVEFVLLGYWTCATYVEAFQPFSAGADASWQSHSPTSDATIEIFAGAWLVDFYVLGYWSVQPYPFRELFATVTSPSVDAVWQDVELRSLYAVENSIVSVMLENTKTNNEDQFGVRGTGSTRERLLDLHEAEAGGGDHAALHAASGAACEISVYHEDVSDAHAFILMGAWGDVRTHRLLTWQEIEP